MSSNMPGGIPDQPTQPVTSPPAQLTSAGQPPGGSPNAPTQPTWPVPPVPPSQQYRRRPVTPTWLIVLITALALTLILGGFAFILYAATTQYHASLNTIATSYASSTTQSQAQARASAQALANAVANNDATATAQTGATATLTAQTINATATASTIDNFLTLATGGSTVFNDPLSDNSSGNQWNESQNTNDSACVFTGGSYHVIENRQGYLQPCFAATSNFSDFAYQVQVTIDKGLQAGILFRANSATGSYYFFRIGSDGSYALDLYSSNRQAITLTTGFSPVITTGINQSNTLAVIAFQNTFYFYANQSYITTVTNSTLSSGQIGVAAIDTRNPTDAAFSNAQVWPVTADIFATPSPQPSPITTPSVTATPSPSKTPTATPTASPTTTPSPTASPSATATTSP